MSEPVVRLDRSCNRNVLAELRYALSMYRKGQLTPTRLRRDFPHCVEIEIPGSGLRERTAVIDRWLDEHVGRGNYAFTKRQDRPAIREWLQVRFKEQEVAESFRSAFNV